MIPFILYADLIDGKWEAHTDLGRATTPCDNLDELVRQVWHSIPKKATEDLKIVMILPQEEDAEIHFLKPDVI